MLGKLGNEAKYYVLHEASNGYFVYPLAYGDLDSNELDAYSLFVVNSDDVVVRDELNLFGMGFNL